MLMLYIPILQGTLMNRAISFMPQPLPGEHLLGVVARWYLMTAEKDKRVFFALSDRFRQLSPKFIHHPMIDDILSKYGSGLLRETALSKHTLLPYYAPLMKFDRLFPIVKQQKYQWRPYSKTATRSQHSSIESTPFNSVLKFAKNWRWCSQCTAEDMAEFGSPLWHVAHQVPSVVRCYKHRTKALSEKCYACGFEVKDLVNTPQPPYQSYCLCGGYIKPIEFMNSDALDWIENASFDLLRQQESLLSHSHNHIMQRGVQNYCSKVNSAYGRRDTSLIDKTQRKFANWVLSNGLDIFFNKPEVALSGRILDINVGAYQAKNWHPLSALFWLKFLGEPWPRLDAAA